MLYYVGLGLLFSFPQERGLRVDRLGLFLRVWDDRMVQVDVSNPFTLILNPPPPNNKTSPLLHIGTILGGFSIRGKGLGKFRVDTRARVNVAISLGRLRVISGDG